MCVYTTGTHVAGVVHEGVVHVVAGDFDISARTNSMQPFVIWNWQKATGTKSRYDQVHRGFMSNVVFTWGCRVFNVASRVFVWKRNFTAVLFYSRFQFYKILTCFGVFVFRSRAFCVARSRVFCVTRSRVSCVARSRTVESRRSPFCCVHSLRIWTTFRSCLTMYVTIFCSVSEHCSVSKISPLDGNVLL